MPIFMDRHEVSDEVTAEHVARIHHEDLKIQHRYNCVGLTYWFDDVRKTAFCLVDAPNKESLINMHNEAHGKIPHQIIEVDPSIVESFLGRIEDPEKSTKTELNIINDPAFRILIIVNEDATPSDIIYKLAPKFEGRVVAPNLISFSSVTHSIEYSIALYNQFSKSNTSFGIGIASGIPVSDKSEIFEDTIKLAQRFSNISNNNILICSKVKNLYMSENQNKFPYQKHIVTIKPAEEQLLTKLVDFVEESWQNPDLQVDDFHEKLGYSKSGLYRVLKSLTGKSPSSFLKNYRLEKAETALKSSGQTVSEIAFACGFNSPSYFSKCFVKKYDVLPSAFQEIK